MKKIKPYKELYDYKTRLDKIIKKIDKQDEVKKEDIEALSKLGSNILFDSRWANFGLN